MGYLARLSILALATSVVQAHYAFVRLAHNGVWLEPTRYIRNKTDPFEEPFTPNTNVNTRSYHDPTYATDIPNSVRCGRDNMAHAAETEILTVKAGDTIEVAHHNQNPSDWKPEDWVDCPNGRGSCGDVGKFMDIQHPGPFVAHLSAVPEGTDIIEYDGSGSWTKIYSLGLEVMGDKTIRWRANNHRQLPERFVFKIPEQTPAGNYLLRLDQIWPGLWEPPIYVSGGAQIYATCAQITVESQATGPLPEGIKIPEGLATLEPGMQSSLAMYRGESLDEDFVNPGGLLWTGTEMIEDDPEA